MTHVATHITEQRATWAATHRLELDGGRVVHVMRRGNVAWTAERWAEHGLASFSISDGGRWRHGVTGEWVLGHIWPVAGRA